MSNTLKRILIGIIGIPAILYITYIGGHLFFAFCLLVQSLCLWEFIKMFKNKNYNPFLYNSIFMSAVIITFYVYLSQYFKYSVILVLIMLFVSEFVFNREKSLINIGIVMFGLIYITLPFALLFELDKDYTQVYLLLLLIWANDSFAFFGGKYFGKHKFSKISPNKTVEGLVSGFVFTILTSYIFHLFFKQITVTDSIVIGVFISVFGPLGDLFESFLKRFTNIKDSSKIIPGHGGLLDRFDSLIFCTPFIFIYFKYIKYFLN